eukprot:2578783-Rhodomonas_salina.6
MIGSFASTQPNLQIAAKSSDHAQTHKTDRGIDGVERRADRVELDGVRAAAQHGVHERAVCPGVCRIALAPTPNPEARSMTAAPVLARIQRNALPRGRAERARDHIRHVLVAEISRQYGQGAASV